MMECNQIHSFCRNEETEEDDEEEDIGRAPIELDNWVEDQKILDKPASCYRNNETVKIFDRKYVRCFENPIVYAFKQCGYQCICEKGFENKGDADFKKSA